MDLQLQLQFYRFKVLQKPLQFSPNSIHIRFQIQFQIQFQVVLINT